MTILIATWTLTAVLAAAGTTWTVLLVRSGGRSWHPGDPLPPVPAGAPLRTWLHTELHEADPADPCCTRCELIDPSEPCPGCYCHEPLRTWHDAARRTRVAETRPSRVRRTPEPRTRVARTAR